MSAADHVTMAIEGSRDMTVKEWIPSENDWLTGRELENGHGKFVSFHMKNGDLNLNHSYVKLPEGICDIDLMTFWEVRSKNMQQHARCL